mgnify:CR=1 FL=1
MGRRNYRMDKRAEAAEETRRRIVEACFALHSRQGIATTTMSQIAEAAGVSIGTVYHHFPSYDDAVTACGEFTAALAPLPGPEALADDEDLAGRLAALAGAVFGFYDSLPFYARVRGEKDRFEPVARFVDREVANRRALTRIALNPFGASERTVKLIAAMLDVAVYEELREAGFSAAAATRAVAGTLAAAVEARQSAV